MKKLYGYYGGSRMYGFPVLETSDWDYYSVGTSRHITAYKIYPNIKLHQKKRSFTLDVEKVELCSYLTYLMNGFVFQVESLFVPQNWMDYLDPNFGELVLKNRHLLIDRCQLLENFGSNVDLIRKKTKADIAKLKAGVLSSTRNEKLIRGVSKIYDEYEAKGYYHKDYIHHIRMAACILSFLEYDTYPIANLKEADPVAFQMCSDIKNEPNRFTREELDKFLNIYLTAFDKFNLDNDEEKFRFDATYAQKVVGHFYP